MHSNERLLVNIWHLSAAIALRPHSLHERWNKCKTGKCKTWICRTRYFAGSLFSVLHFPNPTFRSPHFALEFRIFFQCNYARKCLLTHPVSTAARHYRSERVRVQQRCSCAWRRSRGVGWCRTSTVTRRLERLLPRPPRRRLQSSPDNRTRTAGNDHPGDCPTASPTADIFLDNKNCESASVRNYWSPSFSLLFSFPSFPSIFPLFSFFLSFSILCPLLGFFLLAVGPFESS